MYSEIPQDPNQTEPSSPLSLQPVTTSFSTYSNLDTRQTSRKEILGWLSFSFAAEPFAVAAVGIYLPLLLDQLGRENSVQQNDHSVKCTSTDTNCVVPVLGTYVDPASFALYTFSTSVFLQAITVISMSGAADRGNFRKKLLLAFSCLGGLSAILLVFAVSSAYYLAAILTIIGNVSFGAVAVCGNAFLPVLVRNHPDVRANENNRESYDPEPDSFESFPITTLDRADRLAARQSEISTELSGLGVACGYTAAFIVQTSGVVFVASTNSSLLSVRLVIMAVGIWWLLFTIPTALLVRSRPGPRLHMRDGENKVVRYVTYAWKTLYHTAKDVRKLKDVGMYLAGWFILSDSSTTINATAILFAKTELHMSAAALAVVGIIMMVFGVVGAVGFSRYGTQILKLPPNQMIALIVAVTALIPAYGMLGFMTNSVGLHHPWEIFVLAAVYGVSVGGMSSVCRSTFAILVPPGKESTFFALYAVTDKGSSIIGPTVTAFITDKTHNIRYTFYFLFILLLCAIPIFYNIDVDRGKREALTFGHQEEEEEEEEEEECQERDVL
ncbi:autophagy-related protein 22-like protein [Lipomyces arxii]|uniref:autophagy-related protein 22-like protein n=1 Tax=Lipomyces arxii TaxID=56418 RepID=UPI0034CF8565